MSQYGWVRELKSAYQATIENGRLVPIWMGARVEMTFLILPLYGKDES